MTERPGGSGTDPIGEFQQWLVRSGAREVGRGVRGRIRSALGLSDAKADVWESATTTPPGEAPECAWCPVCRAARLLRETGPGVGSQVAAAGEVLASVVQDAVSTVEAALAATGRAAEEQHARSAWSAGAAHAPAGGAADVPVGGAADVPAGGAADVPAGGAANVRAGGADDVPGDGAEAVPAGDDGATDSTMTEQETVTGQEEPGQQGRGDEPRAAEPPEGPPHEPDDRG